MKKSLLFVVPLALILFQGCKEGKKNTLEYSRYISGFTRGMIRSTDPVHVRLESGEFGALDTLPVPAEELFKISPRASGTVSFHDHTFEFIPSGRLKNGQTYRVTLRLGMIRDMPSALSTFEFDVSVIPQSFSFEEGKLNLEENEEDFYYRGKILNADVMDDPAEVEQLVKASFHDKKIAVEWEHESPYSHDFIVRHLARGDDRRVLSLTFDKRVKNGNDLLVEVPGKGSFYALEARPGGQDSRHVEIVMSDRLDASQYLAGLVKIEGIDKLNFAIEGNIILVYTNEQEKLRDAVQVTVFKGIKSKVGDKLPEDAGFQVRFPSVAPKVQFIGEGTFSPSEGNALVPFSAVGLKAVQLRVIKVFARNMNFFLQDNSYSRGDDFELVRVARPVLDKRIDLVKEGEPFNPNKWQDYTVNLADHLALEKGVIYRVELYFRRSFTALPCARDKEDKPLKDQDWDAPRRQAYDEYDDDEYDDDEYDEYDGYPDDFSWEERNDPCSDSYYYMKERFPWKNIIVTSLGIVAKAGIDGKYAVAVTDLLSAAPVENCTVDFYNFQNQKIDSARTNANGIVVSKINGKAFTIVARKGNDKAYLKVSDNLSLSFSNFDVGGEVVQQGLKGFIYGERDAWRPGDDIYLSFILEDKEGMIPAGHPVIAELYDPNGNVVQVKRDARNEHGLYCFPFKTDKDAMTGYWRVVVKVGGASFSRSVRVETVKPNRLSINIQLPGQVIGRTARVPVQTRWLHGAKTSLLETNTTLKLTPGRTTFPGFEGYVFDHDVEYYSESTLFEGKTDANGNFTLTLDEVDAGEAPGMLNARLTTRVFESSGESSIVTASFKYSPYEEYVGIKLPDSDDYWYLANEPITIQGAVVKPDGKLSGSKEIDLEVYSVQWRWWWDAERDHLASYVNRAYHSPVFTGTARVTGGKFSTQITCKEWGRYLVIARDKASGHVSSTFFYVRSGHRVEIPGMATLLQLASDKKSYVAGDKIEITFPSSAGSAAIVSVENGRSVRDIFRVPTREGSTSFSITATAEMCPNVYVNVSLVQPHATRDNDKPIRLYGVLNIPVETPALRLQPRVEMDEELRPSRDFTVSVSEANGKPMTYTLAVVDEGLLAITSFRTPDPFPVFYAREALGVRTWDFYDEVAGAYGGRLEKALAVGGDEGLVDDGNAKNNRFTPVVIFRGPFSLEPGEKKTHELSMPEYIGEVRTMVVAVNDGRYGAVAKAARVNAPLMLNVTMPRLFTPGDRVSIPVTVFAAKDNIKEVEVTMLPDKLVELTGPARQKVQFSETGERVIFFDVKIRENTGKSTITLEATSGTERARFSTDVEIRVPNPRVTRVDPREIKPGETITFNNAVEGIEPLATLEVTSIPPLNLEQRLDELIRYPHGCAEQVTSAAYPQLMLDVLADMTEGQRVTVGIHVKEVINRLRTYQVADGGFAYWPGGRSASDWVSSYVTDFLVGAEKQGYLVPASMKNAALAYLDRLANAWRAGDFYSEIEQSYRLHVLAASGKPNRAAMNRMKEIDYKNPVARWQLAGAFAASKHEETARALVANLPAEATLYRQTGRCYGSTLRDNAIILQAMIDMDKRAEALELLGKMARRFSSDEWLSTQESAFGLHAIGNYVKKYLASDNGVSVTIDNAPVVTIRSVVQRALVVKNQHVTTTLKNNAGGILHARLVTSSIPTGVITKGEASGLKMTATYRRDKGIVKEHRYKQGEDVNLEISVTNTGNAEYDELALSYLFPSGLEFYNERLIHGTDPFPDADHADIRDDRVYLYFSLEQGETKTFNLRFNAAYPGTYLLPALTCSAMYDNTITATLPGDVVSITRDE
ncbi:MAG: alpha-2-macroglobulin [Odoribacteraceae bacterium]|jgi:uncharacterized protein YfaS (alpha-2-macroglobulin family)|nr:alpha-2-macroglobulin [Odoribacteraceae bacterium]